MASTESTEAVELPPMKVFLVDHYEVSMGDRPGKGAILRTEAGTYLHVSKLPADTQWNIDAAWRADGSRIFVNGWGERRSQVVWGDVTKIFTIEQLDSRIGEAIDRRFEDGEVRAVHDGGSGTSADEGTGPPDGDSDGGSA